MASDECDESTRRERAAAIVEDRLDVPMAVLAFAWGGLVAYDLVAPARLRSTLGLISNVIWSVFVIEFVAKLWVSGHPLRFLRTRWPSVLFLALPLLRIFRLVRALRALRALPLVRVAGSGYRTIGSARLLLSSRLAYLGAVTATVVFAGAQMLYLVEQPPLEGGSGLAEALWWSANLAISGNYTFQPASLAGRLVCLLLTGFAVVVFASVAASVGAFFLESRAEAEGATGENL